MRSAQISTASELKGIVDSFQVLEHELRANFYRLEKKTFGNFRIKGNSPTCVTWHFNPEDLLYIHLERALKLTNADIGSIMMLEKPNTGCFRYRGMHRIGRFRQRKRPRQFLQIEMPSYAVLNKTLFWMEDIETDIRFGRKSRTAIREQNHSLHARSKTINDVIGVLTISRRKSDDSLAQEDVNVLSPLLSNADLHLWQSAPPQGSWNQVEAAPGHRKNHFRQSIRA